jgi:hypothetical protein
MVLVVVSFGDKRAALDPDALLSEAARVSGVSSFGDERFVHALRMMTRYYAEDIQVDETGLARVRTTVVNQLVNRARFEHDVQRHPRSLTRTSATRSSSSVCHAPARPSHTE